MQSREDQKQYFCNAAIILREDESSVSETDFDLDSDLAMRSESDASLCGIPPYYTTIENPDRGSDTYLYATACGTGCVTI
jgi:hypothetical protein